MLRQDRHPNLDFFVADLWAWPVKDDQASMEHPLFSLTKKPDIAIRHYEHNGNTITVTPSVRGMPTIWDKDVLIYCCSQLIAGMQQGREPKQVIRMTVYDFMISTNRSIGKRGYELLKLAFERLAGVRIVTNITTGSVAVEEGFGLLEWWRIVKRSSTDQRMMSVELKLSDWLYRAITNYEVLTLHRDYFRLDGGIERRIYELARKHCGNQETWSIHLPLLYKKAGSRSELKLFRFAIRKLVQSDHLPEYWLRYAKSSDKLTVYPRSHKGGLRGFKDALGLK